MRTSTSARSIFGARRAAPRAPRPSPRPRPRPRQGSLPSPRSSCHGARARGRPRPRSSSFLSLPSDGEHGDDTNAASGGRLDLDRAADLMLHGLRIRRSPKCGSSSVTAAMPRPRSSTSTRSCVAVRPHTGRTRPWIRNAWRRWRAPRRPRLCAVSSTAAGTVVEVALDRDARRELPALHQLADEGRERRVVAHARPRRARTAPRGSRSGPAGWPPRPRRAPRRSRRPGRSRCGAGGSGAPARRYVTDWVSPSWIVHGPSGPFFEQQRFDRRRHGGGRVVPAPGCGARVRSLGRSRGSVSFRSWPLVLVPFRRCRALGLTPWP